MMFIIGVTVGGAAVWFGKDKLTLWYKGAAGFIAALEAKISAIKAKV